MKLGSTTQAWVPDDRLLNDVGDYVETTDNPDDGINPKDKCKITTVKPR